MAPHDDNGGERLAVMDRPVEPPEASGTGGLSIHRASKTQAGIMRVPGKMPEKATPMRFALAAVAILSGCPAVQPAPRNQDASRSVAQNCVPGERATTPKQLLAGTWRHVELVRVVDGHRLAPQTSAGESFVRYECDGTWVATSPNSRSAGTYRWVGENQVEHTIIESNLAIQLGYVSVKRVAVDAQHLELQIEQTAEEMAKLMPPPRPGTRTPNSVLVITRFDRVNSK